MNAQIAKRIQERTLALLKPLEQEFGVQLSFQRGTYSSTFSIMKLQAAEASQPGGFAGPESDAFRQLATLYGLRPEDLGRSFFSQGKFLTVAGLKPRAPKKPIVLHDKNGRRYSAPADMVRAFLKVDYEQRPPGDWSQDRKASR